MRALNASRAVVPGVAAGLVGTTALLIMRAFDERYAPMTVEDARYDRDAAVSFWLRIGAGVIGGAVYGLLRRRGAGVSALGDGAAIGAAAYAAGTVASLLLTRRRRPIWGQAFPEIAGELLRQLAYGVTTAAAFSALHPPARRRR